MFIESGASDDALRQDGHVEFEYLAFTVDMALLTEGASGRLASINISLLTEGNVQTQATNELMGFGIDLEKARDGPMYESIINDRHRLRRWHYKLIFETAERRIASMGGLVPVHNSNCNAA